MAADDLHQPLGLDGPPAGRPGRSLPLGRIALGGMGAAVAGLVAFSLVTDLGMGGRPFAEAAIQPARVEEPPPVAPPPVQQAARETPAADATIGVRSAPQGVSTQSGGLFLKVPQEPVGLQLTPAPDPRLVEKGRHGPLPRIGPDGARASEIYARPVVSAASLKAGAPRIALVVGGMGLNPASTSAAMDLLPGEVTLGFAPYGGDLDRQVANARDSGHEVLLQAPMEPLDKASIPGPYTLLSGADPAQNLDGLRWVMSRMTGYVGVANFLGGRFLSREADLSPVLSEIGKRGLLFFDDGTAPQSLAPRLAAAANIPVARADVVLDANARPEAVEAALVRLEALARTRGYAIGYAAGLPGSVEPVARFARGLERRGIVLAPLSALAVRGAASAGLPQ